MVAETCGLSVLLQVMGDIAQKIHTILEMAGVIHTTNNVAMQVMMIMAITALEPCRAFGKVDEQVLLCLSRATGRICKLPLTDQEDTGLFTREEKGLSRTETVTKLEL